MGIFMMPNGNGGLTPIVTPNAKTPTCPNCHKDEDVKRFCKHCNYVYPDEPEKPLSLSWKLFFALIIGFVVFVLIVFIDKAAFDSKYANKFFYGTDCEFVVPAGYKIKYSETEKKYAVACLEWGNYYLYNGRHGIDKTFSHVTTPALFDDSCEAKAYLKAYIKSIEPKINDYK